MKPVVGMGILLGAATTFGTVNDGTEPVISTSASASVTVGDISGGTVIPKLILRTNGSDRVTIDGSGNMGIGKTPVSTRKLIVGGFLEVSGTGIGMVMSNGYTPIGSTTATTKTWDLSGRRDTLDFNETGVRTVMTLAPGGNVGIGTKFPSATALVHVQTDVGINKYPLQITSGNYKGLKLSTSNADSYVLFTANPSKSGSLVINSNVTNMTGPGGIIFATGDPEAATDPVKKTVQGIGVEAARFTAAGDFTMGGGLPASGISFQITKPSPWISLVRTNSGSEAGFRFHNPGPTPGTTDHYFWMWQDNNENDLKFASSGLADEDDTHPRLVMPATSRNIIANTSGGNFGIGQAANKGRLVPEYQLHVSTGNYKAVKLSTTNPSSDVFVSASPTTGGNLVFNSYNGTAATNAGFRFTTGNPDVAPYGKELVRINPDGKFGIGTPSPEASLDVNGSAIVKSRDATWYSSLRVQGPSQTYGLEIDYFGGSSYTKDTYGAGYTGAAVMNVNNAPLVLGTSNLSRLHIAGNGDVGIGRAPSAKLDVAGNANISGSLTVASVNTKVWSIAPDYVFEDDYKLASLDRVESFVKQNKHLPEVPSAKQIKEKGLDLAEMNLTLLKKVEELTLHAIRQEKELKRQAEEIRLLKGR